MTRAFFISDLHGSVAKYEFLFESILRYQPEAVFIGGDLTGLATFTNQESAVSTENFLSGYLSANLQEIRDNLHEQYPKIFVIMGNDDYKLQEAELWKMDKCGLIIYVNERIVPFQNYLVAGYSYVPPTPFMNKDWEKYDVSRFVDVGCVLPEAGFRSVPTLPDKIKYDTIKCDLQQLFSQDVLSKTICLFHAPPYQTKLDRAALDGKYVDYAPLDVHIGSIAIKEFILQKSPHITLHGHVHESTRLTGEWKEIIGNTFCFQAALERNDIGLISFDLENPQQAEMIREKIN